YTAYAGANPVYESAVMRFYYTSLTAPWSAIDYDMETRERTVVKEQPVRGGYDRGEYETDRLWATSRDGVRVPVSIVHRNGLHLAIRGRSAGGLLIGAVLNECPQLFACAVAQVPFVDALTTMLDESLPLTVNEYEEWGNPNDVEYYEYIKSYSPYDNVAPAEYP